MHRIITSKEAQDSRALRLALCFLLLAVYIQPAAADPQPENIGLSAALDMMQRAKTHSGYSSAQVEKCLLPYIATVCDNWDSIPSLLRDEYRAMFQRPDDPQSWWYKAGLPKIYKTPHFVFHYTTTGPDAVLSKDVSPFNGVPDLVEVCAEGYEKSYRVEVSEMGYRAPYDDFWMNDNGGDERYDVYMFSGPWLGFTMPEFPVAVQSTSVVAPMYFGINSRMYEFLGESEGERYAETTCAHEFFHSVQFRYNYNMYRWYMEASSTWIERMVYDGDEFGETDANNYYNSQLTYWFRYPDWSLTFFNGWHEYGDVIWNIFLTERYDVDIVKDFLEDLSEGTYRELANFYDVFTSRGTTLGVAFKEFTLWNYFTRDRHDDRFYSHGAEYPQVSIHPEDVHQEYPVRVDLDSEQAPEELGSRYIRFLPAPGQNTLSIKVDGSDVPGGDDIQRLHIWGTRGWGAKLVIHRKDRLPKPDEIFLFQMSQEGQRNFTGFGTDIEEVVLILSNLHPEFDIQSVSYSAGQQPQGRLSEPKLARGDAGEVYVSWELLDLSGIREVAVVRKRFAPYEYDTDDSPITIEEVYGAPDADSNGLSDPNLDIAGKVGATDTVFVDNPLYYESVRYYYAVVPVSEYGIMGTPSISANGIAPTASTPTVTITTQSLAPGEWSVSMHASQPLNNAPELVSVAPDGRRIPIKLTRADESYQLWQGEFTVSPSPPGGIYTYIALLKRSNGSVNMVITEGGQFLYTADSDKKDVICAPNPFKPDVDGDLKFYSSGFEISKIRIFTIAGEHVIELSGDEWDGKNEGKETVASGIYIYLAEGDGVEKTGKIAVIR